MLVHRARLPAGDRGVGARVRGVPRVRRPDGRGSGRAHARLHARVDQRRRRGHGRLDRPRADRCSATTPSRPKRDGCRSTPACSKATARRSTCGSARRSSSVGAAATATSSSSRSPTSASSLVHADQTEEGMMLLDEALAAVAGSDVDDFCVLQEIFCQLFAACEHAHDVVARRSVDPDRRGDRGAAQPSRGVGVLPHALRRRAHRRRALARSRRRAHRRRAAVGARSPHAARRRARPARRPPRPPGSLRGGRATARRPRRSTTTRRVRWRRSSSRRARRRARRRRSNARSTRPTSRARRSCRC